ncbi:MAG TPA: hypothetical protein VF834_19425 [Streptosporangiaceae bacterium]
MRSRTFVLRWAGRGGTAAVVAGLGLAGLASAQSTALAAADRTGVYSSLPAGSLGPRTNPYSPAYGHSYRRGVVPTTGQQRLMRRWAATTARKAASSPAATAANSMNLTYGGGVHGVGVATGPEKVYLVFWGSQWGTPSTDSHGNLTLANDPSGMAPYLQQLFKGLGTGGETWSGVMTQYCDGVAYNAATCPSNSWHVGYPAGGALAGAWADESVTAPDSATGNQLGTEAIAAAHHFGNTTSSANRDAQYVIVSPTGTHPDGFNTRSGQFCAWHDDTADPNLPAGPVTSSLDLAFTNLPYVTDLGVSCGQNFVNPGPSGLTDGMSIVEGHEYAETITDMLPAFGWTNAQYGAENGDLCAWNPVGGPGGTDDLTLPTGTFAMQSTWANDSFGGGCEFTHPIVTDNWVLNGGFESGSLAHWTAAGTAGVSSSAHSGKYSARLGKHVPTSGDSSISQTFTARTAQLSFWYSVTCPDTVSQSWATASLTDNTANTTVTVLARTCLAHSGWKQVTYPVVAGHSYTLRLVSHDDNDTAAGDGSYALFDDVTNS